MKKFSGWLFLLIGLGMGYWVASDVYVWQQAQDWQPVQARLLDVAMDENSGDDSTTWKVTARYEYSINNVQHQSDRVGISAAADNIGDYHQRVYQQLQQAWQNERRVTAWVNPDQPDQALLNRELRPALTGLKGVFPLVFGGVGMIMLLAGRRSSNDANMIENPEAPWLQRKQWQSTTLRSDGRNTRLAATVMALIWCAASLPLLLVIPGEVRDGNHGVLIALLFPIIGVGLIVCAVREWLRWRRYGQSRLQLDVLPVPLGGGLQGKLVIPAKLSSRSVQAQLLCLRRTVSGSGKNRNTKESILWENRYDIGLQSGSQSGHGGSTNASAHTARIAIPVPQDQPVSDWENARNQIIWRLDVSASEPGVDYASSFELPVFAVAESDQATVDNPVPSAPFQTDLWRDTGVQHGFTSSGQRFYWPRFRLATAGLVVLLVGLLFAGVGLFLFWQEQSWILGGLFSLGGLLILWGAVTMLFQHSEIIVGQGQLRYVHGIFARQKSLSTGEIQSISHRRSGQLGNHTYYRINMQRWGQSDPVIIADWIPGERQTAALCEMLRQFSAVRD